MKDNHEISYIKNMCEGLSDDFNEEGMENEIKAFSNFLCSSSIGYRYTRSYLEEQFKKYVIFRKKVINHKNKFKEIRDFLVKKKLLKFFPENTKIELVINDIFKIDLSEDYKLIGNEQFRESDFYTEAKTDYFYNSVDLLTILIIVEFNTKKIYRYFNINVKEGFDNKINGMIDECKKVANECWRDVNEK